MIKRKIIIIDKVLQFRYAGILIASMIMVIGIIVGNIMYFVQANKEIIATSPGAGALIYGMTKSLVIILICYVILVTIYSLFVSHKFAGPIYRFKQTLNDMANGDLTARVFLRDKDELNDMRESLNKAVKKIHTLVKQDKEKTQEIQTMLKNVKEKVSASGNQEAAQEINLKLGEIENKLYEIGNQFKI